MNVTVLLVLTTLFISVSNSLQKTSYIKMIEIYLLFSLSMPFSEVLLITLLDLMRYPQILCSMCLTSLYLITNIYVKLSHRHSNKDEGSRVFVPTADTVNNKTTRRYIKTYVKMLGSAKVIMVTRVMGMVGLPIICILFNITYFVIGMSG